LTGEKANGRIVISRREIGRNVRVDIVGLAIAPPQQLTERDGR
jgi:hypothetical protein